ncbi:MULTISPECIES: hypothetical protein [unclassified Microbacterium]|uniref:hypothetical protein n=1 Tax=unclassified Microbacterium TaxID=2609290 RepID=UPI00341E7A8A
MGVTKKEVISVDCGADPRSLIAAIGQAPVGSHIVDLEVIEPVPVWDGSILGPGTVRLTFERPIDG